MQSHWRLACNTWFISVGNHPHLQLLFRGIVCFLIASFSVFQTLSNSICIYPQVFRLPIAIPHDKLHCLLLPICCCIVGTIFENNIWIKSATCIVLSRHIDTHRGCFPTSYYSRPPVSRLHPSYPVFFSGYITNLNLPSRVYSVMPAKVSPTRYISRSDASDHLVSTRISLSDEPAGCFTQVRQR